MNAASNGNPFPGLRPFRFQEHELFFGREEQYEQMICKLSETRFLAVVGTSGSGKSSLVRAGLLPALYGGLMSSAGSNWRVALFRPKDDPIRELALSLNHRRVFGDRAKENGSSLFKLSESIDWPALCCRVSREAAETGRNPSRRVLEVLASESRHVIAEPACNGDIDDKSKVVQAFNHLLKQRGFYQSDDFTRVGISREARALIAHGQQNLTEAEIEKLNRLILEASYPQEIAKKGEIQTQITEVTLRRGDLGLIETVREAKMSPDENLLIVVDQFEELFRYAEISEDGPHGNQAAAFVKLLLQAKDQREFPIYVVLTMRSDYLGDCAKFWDLPEAINQSQYLIPRLTREQRRQAIVGPIKLRGANITPQLVNQLLNDMGDNPDQLPTLQHALMRTWDSWLKDHHGNEPLDIRHYASIGRMAHALSIHADEAFGELPNERSRYVARQLFRCLTEKSSGDREIRRPTSMRDIRAVTKAKFKEIVPVIDVFRQEGRSFLMPSPGKPLKRNTSIDISHESLIRNWLKLKKWVDREAQSANVYRRLVTTAKLYELGQAGVLTDLEVQYALKWKQVNKPNPNWASRYHTDLDISDDDYCEIAPDKTHGLNHLAIFDGAMRFLEKSRKACWKRTQINRYIKALVAVWIVFIVAVAWVFFQWYVSRQEKFIYAHLAYGAGMNLAEREFDEGNFAEVNRWFEHQLVGAERKSHWYESVMPASFNLFEPKEPLQDFEWYHLWRLTHKELKALHKGSSRILSVASLKNSEIVAAVLSDGTIKFHNLNKQKEWTVKIDFPNLATVQFASDGKALAIGAHDGRLALFYLSEDLQSISAPRELGRFRQTVAFSPDGKLLAAGSGNGVNVWEIGKPQEAPKANPTDDLGFVWALAFSSDSQRLAIAGERLVKILDVTRGTSVTADLTTSSYQPAPISSVAFSPNSDLLALALKNGIVMLWDLESNKHLVSLVGHSLEVRTVTFSADGTLASGSKDGSIRVWNVGKLKENYRRQIPEANQGFQSNLIHSRVNLGNKPEDQLRKEESDISKDLLLKTLTGHSRAVNNLAFLPTQNQLVSGSEDGSVFLWTTNENFPFRPTGELWTRSSGSVSSVAFMKDGKLLAVGSNDGTVTLWRDDLNKPGEKLQDAVFAPFGRTLPVAISLDGRILAAGSRDNTVALWDLTTNKQLASLTGHDQPVVTIAFSRDSKTIATGSADRTVRLWDVNDPSKVPTLLRQESEVLSLAFSPAADVLAIGAHDNTIRLVNPANPEQRPLAISRHDGPVSAIAFSTDGRIATGSWDSTARLWDARTLRELARFEGHSGQVLSVTFTPNNKRLATSSVDGSVKLWDTSYLGDKGTQYLLVTLKDSGSKSTAAATSVAFANGELLAVGNADGSVLLRYGPAEDERRNR